MSADLLARLKLDQLNAQKQRKILEVLLRQEINADIRYSYLKILRKADERILYNQEIINQFVLTWRRINANQYIHAEHISESDSIDGNMI